MADGGKVVDLRVKDQYRPDLASLAREQVISARRQLETGHGEFAEILAPLLGWEPSAEVVESWETVSVPPGDVLVAVSLLAQGSTYGTSNPSSDLMSRLVAERYADLTAVYPTRSEFLSNVPPATLFEHARSIQIVGLSLNVLCQQYPEPKLRELIESGTSVRCLFLDPQGEEVQAREAEEGHIAGHLAALTQVNIQMLVSRVQGQLSDAAKPRLQLATYDAPVRFNIILVDDELCVMQPYLPSSRGVDTPTFMIQKRGDSGGLHGTFREAFNTLWERGTLV